MISYRPPKKPTLTLDAAIVQDNVPIEIIPKLFIGSIHAACNEDALYDKKITHILNSSRFPPMYPSIFSYLSVDLRDKDDSNILLCIPAANIFIEAGMDAGGILVHCFGGRSRSAAFITAYLMSSRRLSFDAVLAQLKAVRPVVSINRGFELQLRSYFDANFDVYVAQQLMLRARMKELCMLRRSDDVGSDPPFPKMGAKISRSNSSSVGHKRAWGDVRAAVDMDCEEDNDDDDEEGQRKLDPSILQSIGAKSGSEASRHQLIYSHTNLPVSSSSSTTVAKSSVPGVNPKSPSCLLSRPGTSTIRVIPPLRGLDRGFCCTGCGSLLFCLANVIRPVGTYVVDKSDGARAERKASGIHTSTAQDYLPSSDTQAMDVTDSDMDAVFSNSTFGSFPVTMRGTKVKPFQFDEQQQQPQLISAPTPSNRRGSKSFGFDDLDEQLVVNGPLGSGSFESHGLVVTRTAETASVSTKHATHISEKSSEPRIHHNTSGKLGRGITFSISTDNNEPAAAAAAVISTGLDGGVSLPSSPHHSTKRISDSSTELSLFTPVESEGSSGIDALSNRPPSAEKLRWLARLNLLADQSGLGPSSDVKVAKMAADDEDALRLSVGNESHVVIEYMGWMGDALFAAGGEPSGELHCYICRLSLGSWSWSTQPSVEEVCPVIRIRKQSVFHPEMTMDRTPCSTPRPEDKERDKNRSSTASLSHRMGSDLSAK